MKILKSKRASKWKASIPFNMRLQCLSRSDTVIQNICGFLNVIKQYSKIKNQIFNWLVRRSQGILHSFSFYIQKYFIWNDFSSCPELKEILIKEILILSVNKFLSVKGVLESVHAVGILMSKKHKKESGLYFYFKEKV